MHGETRKVNNICSSFTLDSHNSKPSNRPFSAFVLHRKMPWYWFGISDITKQRVAAELNSACVWTPMTPMKRVTKKRSISDFRWIIWRSEYQNSIRNCPFDQAFVTLCEPFNDWFCQLTRLTFYWNDFNQLNLNLGNKFDVFIACRLNRRLSRNVCSLAAK